MATPASFLSNAFRRKLQRTRAPRRPAIVIAPSERARLVKHAVVQARTEGIEVPAAELAPVPTPTPAPVVRERFATPLVPPHKKKKKK